MMQKRIVVNFRQSAGLAGDAWQLATGNGGISHELRLIMREDWQNCILRMVMQIRSVKARDFDSMLEEPPSPATKETREIVELCFEQDPSAKD